MNNEIRSHISFVKNELIKTNAKDKMHDFYSLHKGAKYLAVSTGKILQNVEWRKIKNSKLI